jgi:hypothetical protein
MSEAIALYGEPFESEPSEETMEITVHSFQIGRYHQAVAMEWQASIRSITYWSAKSDPSRDLGYVLECYKDDSRWLVLEEGYWYQSEDGKLKLWCSAAPAIGVGCVEFFSAKAEFKIASDLKKLDDLDDPTWASNDAITDLQRRFVMRQDTGLLDFARRSKRIAVSGDGRNVFIVRDHHAYDVGDGFIELNCPPEPGEGYSTQVINFFTCSDDGSSWSKAALPRDADVESIRVEGDICHLEVRRTTTGRLILLSGPTGSASALCPSSLDKPLMDEQLWAALEAAAAEQGRTGNSDAGSA